MRIAVLVVTLSALLVCIPRALQAIPAEAMGLLVLFLLFPALLVYGSFYLFTFQLTIKPDRLAVESIPNPFRTRFQCGYADISGIEKDEGWSSLSVFRFKESEPCRIPRLELLESNPADLLDEIKTRISAEVFTERTTGSLRRWWKWHKLLTNCILILGAGWLSLQLLNMGGMLDFARIPWTPVLTVLLEALVAAGFLDLLIIRFLNRDK